MKHRKRKEKCVSWKMGSVISGSRPRFFHERKIMSADKKTHKELDIELIQKMLDVTGQWLRKNGWVSQCRIEDFCWKWFKTIDGVVVMCDLVEAVNIEKHLEPDDEES